MGKPTITGATGGGKGTKPCGWQDKCQKHKKAIPYAKKANLDRGDLSNWPRPAAGQPANNTKIKDKHKSGKLLKGKTVTGTNYKFQRHHVLPVEVFKSGPMRTNLTLLGYDINVFGENGISLPFRLEDMVWHDLQCHRGSHPIYTGKVEKWVEKIMDQCGQYCKKGEQTKLWDEIKDLADDCIEKINDWSLMIHPWAKAEYKKAKLYGWI